MKKIFLSSVLSFLMLSSAHSADFMTNASHAYLIDFETGAVLLDKRGDELMAPASMSKLMTAYMIFERLKHGQLSLEDTFEVSENAWRKGGEKSGSSTMFLKPNSKVTVGDLIQGIVVQSGNDACITAAENLSGSEENFAAEMTIKAREIGLEKSIFANATGWPNPNQKMTAKELAKLAQILIREFPEYYPIYSQKSFKYNGIKQDNRNPLLYDMPDRADGLKTGHTQESGYSLVGSAVNQDKTRRQILVVNGLKTMADRRTEAKRLMDWGFREFDNYRISSGKTLASIPVFMGSKDEVPVSLEKNLVVTLKRLDKLKAKLQVESLLPKAPIAKGQKVAVLKVILENGQTYSYPLIADENVDSIGYFGKFKQAVKSFLPLN